MIEWRHQGHGFATLDLLAAEGIVTNLQRALFELGEDDPATYQSAFDLILRTANDPSILGMATHLLYVGRKALRKG